MKFVRFWLFCIMAIVIAYPTQAQKPYEAKTPDPLSESWRYTFFHELEDKGIRTLAKSSDENIYWFGVNDGLLKYDGITWKKYTGKDGLIGGSVSKIYVDKDDLVYAATNKGLFTLKGNKWTPVILGADNESFEFKVINKLEDGSIFCGTTGGAILITSKNKYYFSSAPIAQNFLNNHPEYTLIDLPADASFNSGFLNISDIFEYENGKIWLAISSYESGLILEFDLSDVEDGSIDDYTLVGNAKNIKFGNDQKIIRAQDNKIWIINRSTKIGAYIIENENWSSVNFNTTFGDDEYSTSIAESQDGTVWIGGIGKVFAIKKDQTIKRYTAPSYKIPTSYITVYTDNNNELLIFGHLSNVLKVDLSDNQWLTYNELNYQCEGTENNSWFLDVEGRAVINKGNEWFVYDEKDGLIDAPVRIFSTSKNQIWAVGSHHGSAAVALLEDNRWQKTMLDSLSWGIDYRSVFEAKDGSIYFGGSVDRDMDKGQQGGLVQLLNPQSENKIWRKHPTGERGLDQSNVYGIGQTKNGNIYIGGGRLFSYDNKSWVYSNNEKLREFTNIVYSDDENNLYVGSRYYGLFIYDNTNWTNITSADGLFSNTIISVNTFKDQIWVATDKDISLFTGDTWINEIFPEEMILSNEGGSININNKGEVWINHSVREWKRRAYTDKPINAEINNTFKTYRKIPDKNGPVVSIDLYSEEVDNSGNTLIAWSGEDYFNDTDKSRLLFSFRLNDEPWSEFTTSQNHTFTGLEGGEYTFQLRAMDLDGNISTTPGSVTFSVSPPVWKQAWFIALISFFIILLSIFEYRIITKNRTLSNLNDNLHDAVDQLEIKKEKIEKQNEEIIRHQKDLETNNSLLESKNHEIEAQRDNLKDLVIQIENLSKAKVRFFTNITHEFRTPLSLILGPLESLKNNSIGLSEKNNFHQIIKRNALRLQKLINQLLEIRRIETGTLELILRKGNVVKFVRDIKELFNNQSVQNYIVYTFTSDIDEHEMYFDHDKLEKIVFNLLSNAFKYTPHYKSIKVAITINNYKDPEDENELADIENFIKIEVKDTGRGIEKGRLANIFERYKNVDESLNITNMESTGIGLSYIKDLIEFHQGKVFVESENGKGTTFTIYMPKNMEPHGNIALTDGTSFELNKSLDASIIESEKINVESPETLSNGERSQKSVLVVEDNEDMLYYINSLLKNQYHVLTAINGKKGLEILSSEENVDLVISDVMMPEMDGLKFCEAIKSNFETSHIPVILLTAKNLKENELSGYESGADDYITKPFDPKILYLKTSNVLSSREKLKSKFGQDFKFKPKEIKVTSADEQLINRLVELMEKHISDTDFDVNKMCDMVNLSHMHFIRKVKQLTGKKPIDLLKSFRMQRAKQLLEQNKLNISEIAYMVGYDLPNSFSRAFKKEFNISPTEFVSSQSKDTSTIEE